MPDIDNASDNSGNLTLVQIDDLIQAVDPVAEDETELDTEVRDFLQKVEDALSFEQALSLAAEIIAMAGAALLECGVPASMDDAITLGANLAHLDAAATHLIDVEPIEFQDGDDDDDDEQHEDNMTD